MKRQNGFTLVELMITIAIAAILLSLALPSFRETIMNNRLVTQTNDLVTGFNYARSEAVKNGRNATICVSNNQATCSGNDWADGWLVWVDANNNGAFDAGEERRSGQKAPDSMTVVGSATNFRFDARGALSAPAAGTFSLCDDRTGETGRQLRINATGRIWIDRDFTGCA